jgi:predicted nucleotidyltransferase
VVRTVHEQLLPLIRDECVTFYGSALVSLAVFGSVARGTAKPDSDIDLLIIGDPLPDGRRPRTVQFLQLEDRLREREPKFLEMLLSPVMKTPAELRHGSPLLWDMTEEVDILVDRNGFLDRLLDDVRTRLRNLGARRVFREEGWYWILKPDYKVGEVFEI